MKVAVIGSRSLVVLDLGRYLPDSTAEIISGGALGIDTCAREYALANDIKLTEFLPDYQRYGTGAPLRRNRLIVDAADLVLAFWDGFSTGTKYTINYAKRTGKKVTILCPIPVRN